MQYMWIFLFADFRFARHSARCLMLLQVSVLCIMEVESISRFQAQLVGLQNRLSRTSHSKGSMAKHSKNTKIS